MRIALFGGTFNPVHYGHLLIAEAACESHHLDRVIFVPAGLPPHKRPPRTSAKYRLAMLRLAIRGNPSFKISDREIRAKRVVYTYETLEHFRRRSPGSPLYFILGSDSRKKLPRWRQAKRLPSLCRFITMNRILPFASHEIRRRIRRGQYIRYHVPEAVERYIRAHRLYQKPE
jgi:nicotinate-nucleotide adenylyltransferase